MSEYHADRADLATADAVAVTTGTTDVDASLDDRPAPPPANSAVISGTVTALDGTTPIAGIQVRLYVDGVLAGSTATTTGPDGTYTFANRAPGSYQLWFRDLSGALTNEWHEDEASQATADPVAAANSTVTTVDARLAPR